MVEYLQILTLNARKEMALHLVLICPALLAAQDSNGRFVSNSELFIWFAKHDLPWDQRWFLCRSALHLAASLRLTDLYSALVERGANPHILVKKIHFKIISQELTQTYLTATGKPRCCYGKKRWSVKVLRELQRHPSTPPSTGATTAGRGSVVGRRRFNTQSFNLVLKRCLPLLDVMVVKQLSQHFHISIVPKDGSNLWSIRLFRQKWRKKTTVGGSCWAGQPLKHWSALSAGSSDFSQSTFLTDLVGGTLYSLSWK